MKIISKDKILDIGCGALRSGRWVIYHKNDKEKDNKDYGGTRFALGQYSAKYYSYMYVLAKLGLAEVLWPAQIIKYKSFLKDFHKGKVILFKGKFNFDVIISEKLFNQILSFPNENYSKEIIKDIIKMSPKIK